MPGNPSKITISFRKKFAYGAWKRVRRFQALRFLLGLDSGEMLSSPSSLLGLGSGKAIPSPFDILEPGIGKALPNSSELLEPGSGKALSNSSNFMMAL